jgi:hypothetical protein
MVDVGVVDVVIAAPPEPTAVGGAVVVLLFEEYVDVTDATTWDTVIVRVRVAVDVRVVVEESATARRGRRRAVATAEKRILDVDSRVLCPDWKETQEGISGFRQRDENESVDQGRDLECDDQVDRWRWLESFF